jgi:hypothetical protein
VKLNTLAQPFRRRAPQVAVIGCLAFGVQVACSDTPANPSPSNTTFPMAGTTSTAGTPATTAGTTSTAGTLATAGSFGTAGTPAGGTEAGGTGGAGGTGTAGTATAGTGGTVVVVPTTPYCMGKEVKTLPYAAESNYYPSGWSEGPPVISNPTDLPFKACDPANRVAGAAGNCTTWRYTPAATPAAAWVIWEVPPAAPTTHVCLPEGVNSIAFCARGSVGGEKIMTGGAEVQEAEITLTNEWKTFTVPLAGVTYNTYDVGLNKAFVWKIVPPAAGATVTNFFIDNIQFVKDAPGADYCAAGGGGEGGAGGAGGAGN